ncbi:zinc finger domain-containing protein [Streptomyces sp. NPDC001118]
MVHLQRDGSAALAVEHHDCPNCDAPAGSACRTRGGKTASKYHTRASSSCPRCARNSKCRSPPTAAPAARGSRARRSPPCPRPAPRAR